MKTLSHFTPKDFLEAVCFYFIGNAGYDDLAWFSRVKDKRVNLTKVAIDKTTIPEGKTMFDAFETIKNNEIEYLALPNAARDTTATLFPTMKANIPNLKGCPTSTTPRSRPRHGRQVVASASSHL